jgi:hypothetical protein
MQGSINWKGGQVLWFEEELNVEGSIDSQIDILREDLIAVRFGDSVILDLSWCPEFNPAGQFILTVVRSIHKTSEDWDNPVLEIKFRDLGQFIPNLNQAVETADRLASA